VVYNPVGREQFRRQHALDGKFVVMYSGNHSPCHPLDTLLAAALELRNEDRIRFCFVGGGSEYRKVGAFAARHELQNIVCLPYQPIDRLSASLSAADLHVVAMGGPFAGLVHPCKIYNILVTGIPALYVGPEASHITDIANSNPALPIAQFQHGDVMGVAAQIRSAAARHAAAELPPEVPNEEMRRTAALFSANRILAEWIALIAGARV
jgi:glycosyltransferase involved in cell wall biosynthesis